MLVQVVTFETELSADDFIEVARQRSPAFRGVPGLQQKYFVKLEDRNRFGGVYVWETREAMEAYRASELAASTVDAYAVVGQTVVETAEVLATLR